MTTKNDLLEELKDSNVPPEVISDYWDRTSKSNPEIEKMPVQNLAAGIALAFNTAKTGKLEVPKSDVQQVEVIGKRPDGTRPENVSLNIPSSYKASDKPLDPYAGSGTTPGEILKKQFALADYGSNTENQQKAEQEYKDRLRVNNIGRGLTGMLAGNVAGFDNGASLARNNANWDQYDAQAKDTTVGRITREQDFMKNGIAAFRQGTETAGLVLDQMIKSGEFDINAKKAQLDQKKLQLELIGSTANAQVTQQLVNPRSDMSAAMRTSARAQLALSKMFSPEQIANMVPDDMPGIEAAPIAKLGGESLENLIKKGETELKKGQTAQAYSAAGLSSAQAGAARAQEQQTRVGTAGLVQGQNYSAAMQGMPEPNYAGVGAPNVKGNPMTDEQKSAAKSSSPQMVPHLDANGAVTWQVGSFSQAQGAESSRTLSLQQEQVKNYYQNGAETAAKKAAMLSNRLGGVIGPGGRNIINYSNNPEVKDYQLSIDKLNQEAIQLGLLAPKNDSSMVKGAMETTGNLVSRLPGQAETGAVITGAAGMFNGGQPLTAQSPPKVVQQLAYAVQEARQKQAALLRPQADYARQHSGELVGFINTPEYKNIINASSMVNPRTGELRLVPNSPDAKARALKDGFFEKDKVLND